MLKKFRSFAYILLLFATCGCQFIVNETIKKEIPSSSNEKTKVEKKAVGNKVKNGVYKKYRDNGKLLSEIPMKDGKRHGVAKDYYQNGKLHHEIEYTNGQKNGVAKTYYENGTLYMKSVYQQDLLNGERIIYKESGKPSSVVMYKNNFPGIGLIEYLEDDKPKSKYPNIQIKPINNLASHNMYILQVSFSAKSKKKPEFYVGDLEDGKYIHLEMYPLDVSENQIGILEMELPPQTYIKKELTIVGVYYTALGNPLVVEKKYFIDVINNKN